MKEMRDIILVHLFLNLYLLAIFQPLYPILEYVIHYDYIVEELCENRDKPVLACNGKCYLGKQISATEKKNQEDPVPVPPPVDFDKLITVQNSPPSYSLISPFSVQDRVLADMGMIGSDHVKDILRPPIV